MPLYEYHCGHCGTFEVIRKFSDPALTACPTCGAEIEKLASALNGANTELGIVKGELSEANENLSAANTELGEVKDEPVPDLIEPIHSPERQPGENQVPVAAFDLGRIHVRYQGKQRNHVPLKLASIAQNA